MRKPSVHVQSPADRRNSNVSVHPHDLYDASGQSSKFGPLPQFQRARREAGDAAFFGASSAPHRLPPWVKR